MTIFKSFVLFGPAPFAYGQNQTIFFLLLTDVGLHTEWFLLVWVDKLPSKTLQLSSLLVVSFPFTLCLALYVCVCRCLQQWGTSGECVPWATPANPCKRSYFWFWMTSYKVVVYYEAKLFVIVYWGAWLVQGMFRVVTIIWMGQKASWLTIQTWLVISWQKCVHFEYTLY